MKASARARPFSPFKSRQAVELENYYYRKVNEVAYFSKVDCPANAGNTSLGAVYQAHQSVLGLGSSGKLKSFEKGRKR